jgi:hypothetical protein
VKDVAAQVLPDGVKDWLQYERACREAGTLMFPSEEDVFAADDGNSWHLSGRWRGKNNFWLY